MRNKFTFNNLIKYFFQGLLIIAPLTITAFSLYWIFTSIDNLFPSEIIPADSPLKFLKYRGVGFLLVIIGILVVGYLSSSFIIGRIFELFESLLERTPGIRFIYTSVKDIFDAFVGERRKFDHPVLVNVYANDVWELGFITQNDMKYFGLSDTVAVYCPSSYAIAGKVYLVKSYKVTPLKNISAGEAMKFAVSGGVAELSDSEHRHD